MSPHLVGRPLQQREAIESSRIEGTFTTPEELALMGSEGDDFNPEKNTADTREVSNYITALDWATNQLDTLPISGRLIRGIHERLLNGTRGSDQHPGKFRDIQNFIGSNNDPKRARFVPPPPERLPNLIGDLEIYIHTPENSRRLVRLVRIALIHYQFETVHPFRDGNGRVGRILLPLLLKSEDPSDPPLYLSPFFEKNRQTYYDLLLGVSQRGAFTEWVEFFLEGVVASADSSIALANDLLDLRNKYHDIAQHQKWPVPCLKLIDHLFESPVLTIKRVGRLTGVSTPTASSHLKRLERAGMLSFGAAVAGTFDGATYRRATAEGTFYRELKPISDEFVPEALAPLHPPLEAFHPRMEALTLCGECKYSAGSATGRGMRPLPEGMRPQPRGM